jgi:amidohydrolase
MYYFRLTGIARFTLLLVMLSGAIMKTVAQSDHDNLLKKVDSLAIKINPAVVAWRREIHQHPELSNRETRTAKLVAEHLRALGIEVTTGVAKTGVIGLLKSGNPGPVVALRADMDALPIKEEADLPFRSIDSTMYNGVMTPVSHACGHDSHVAMLLGVAEILSGLKKHLNGTVKFIFQPSEEGPPAGEEGGAKLMVKENALENPKVDVIFGQHISSGNAIGIFTYKPGSVSAENDIFRITIHGRQSHGAAPWAGVDPIVTASQVVMGLQTIISRNTQLTNSAAVITVGSFHAGNRQNIIPAEAVLTGTIRTLDTAIRNHIQQRMREVVNNIAASAGATADVEITMEDAMLVNNIALTEQMAPMLKQIAGNSNVVLEQAGMGSEDFAYFAQKVPGFYFQTGALPPGKKPGEVGHHTPGFMIDENSFVYGVRALCYLTLQYMQSK